MATDTDRAITALKEKVELLTGERASGNRRAVLVSELDNLLNNLYDANAIIKKTVSTLEASLASAKASITQEQLVRVDQNSALAQVTETLKAQIDDNRAEILNQKTVLATKTSALAQSVSNLSATANNTNASVSNEQVARVNADKAIALAVTTASVGAARTYVQDEPPVSTGRLQGDVWYDSNDNYKPYYWNIVSGVGAWVDNSAGTYKVGQVAAISTSLSATQDKVNNTIGVQWAVQGVVDGVTGGLKLTGFKQADGTNGMPNTNLPRKFQLDIDANVSIHGSLTVDGTIINPKIGNNAVSNSAYNQGVTSPTANTGPGWVSVFINLRAGARVSILASYAGGDDQQQTGKNGVLTVYVNGIALSNNTQVITHSMTSVGGVYATTGSLAGALTGLTATYASNPSSLLTFYTAPSDGAYSFNAWAGESTTIGGFTQNVSLLVMELSK